MNYIIFDLESTCWENNRTITREIIEIGAVRVNEQKVVVGEFNAFIRPVIHPELSDFCKRLTTITQDEVDQAQTFPDIIVDFKKWINVDSKYLLCSWGYYDKSQLINDSRIHELDTDWTKNHLSLKHRYAEIKALSRPVGMKGALKLEKIHLDGVHHRGIDDAKNISKIFIQYFDKW
ncbi:exonuclease domain-containing protein [Fulvivirga sp. M361]|uniref:3'-5' exonuclease n=1 Tax=Fulvivirga sp. M361 TaxID=2594266 RepID=UPI00117B70FD|nr:3'-5' exonuclease [Fulvivirga sp. M361]TRX62560.1 exonuclease domain-containing protein [Fulvivirga sp. M361]